MTKVFESSHAQLASESSKLKVVGVRFEGKRGLALVNFGSGLDRFLLLHSEAGTWKVDALGDKALS
jgi:hypothetical protein